MTELPRGWAAATLGEVARWGSGGTPKAGTSAYYDGGIPWAVIGDLHDGTVTSTKTTISTEGLENSSAKLVEAGTLLVAMYGSIGKLGIAGIRMSTNQAIAFAVPHEGMTTTRWLFRYIESQRPLLADSGKGATQQNISQTILKAWPVPLAPLAEQDEILRILDTQLARLDTVMGAVQAVRDRADQLRRSLLHAAFTGQLTQPDPSRGEAVPVDWPVMTLDEINNSDRPICYGILKPGPDIEGGIPYVKVKHIRNRTVAVSDLQRTTPEIEQGFKRSRLEPGDLLITIRGTYGRTAIVPPSLPRGNITQDTARVHAVGADPRYVQNYVESPQGVGFLNSVAKGVAVRGVNIRDLRQMPVPIPPDIEQAEIVRILDAQLTRLYEALAVADRVEAECGRLRRSLLQSAFTGELTRKWREANG